MSGQSEDQGEDYSLRALYFWIIRIWQHPLFLRLFLFYAFMLGIFEFMLGIFEQIVLFFMMLLWFLLDAAEAIAEAL